MIDFFPTVTVIIPTYNRAELVPLAIQSALNQTYRHLEIIVIDDGSTDNTKEVVENFIKRDNRVIYIQHETNKGVSAARNTGIRQAHGEYIAFLDSDCRWLPKKIEKQLDIFREGDKNLGAVSSGEVRILLNSKEIINREGVGNRLHKKLLVGSYWPGGPSAMLIKKVCFKKAGLFDESLSYGEDRDLYIRIAKHFNYAAVFEPLIEEDRRAIDRISSNSALKYAGKMRLLEKYEKEFPWISRLKSDCSSDVGAAFIRQGDMRKGRRYLLQALLAYPFRLSAWRRLIFASIPNSIMKYFKLIKIKIKRTLTLFF